MAKIYTQKARKDYPAQGIKKGDMYYAWCLRPGGRGRGVTYKSLKRPTRAQMTSSGFLSTVYTIFDETLPAIREGSDLENVAQELRDAGEECQSSLDNIPESLQYAPSGEMLQTRIDSCEEAANAAEEAASTLDERLSEIKEAEDAWDADYDADEAQDDDQDALRAEFGDSPDWEELRQEAIDEAIAAVDEPDWG